MVFDLAGAVTQAAFLLRKPRKRLQEHADTYVNAYNDKAAPFVWTKKRSVNAVSRPPYPLSF